MKYRRSVLSLVLAFLFGACATVRAQEAEAKPAADERLDRILERVGEGVARYQAGLFSIAFTETLRRDELREDMTAKKSKEFVFDTIVLREELSEDEEDYYPRPVRRLKTIDGKASKRRSPGREAGYAVSSLGFLLPKHRGLFQFSFDGDETEAGRKLYRIRMLRPGEGEARVEWKRRLVGTSFRVIAPFVYLIWVDAETFEVVRLESHLAAPFEFESPRTFGFGRLGPSRRLRYAAEDYAVRFRRHQFKDPEQMLLVPDSAEWLTVIEGASKPRTRATLRFSNYQRFRSDVKIIEEEEPNE
ncbi:MAG: hypothetical protein ABW208_29070 [Pyrinomonadaceae bacterium]